jgi:integrator complex subunit 4
VAAVAALSTPLVPLPDGVHARVADIDMRVRCAALEALAAQPALPLALYVPARAALSDHYAECRVLALEVVTRLAQQHGEAEVAPLLLLPTAAAGVRLVDDAFVCLCDLVNDSSARVRALGLRATARLHGVGPTHLAQTLDKKVMSHLRRKRSEHEELRRKHGRLVRTRS